MSELLPGGFNQVTDDGDVIPADIPDAMGYTGNGPEEPMIPPHVGIYDRGDVEQPDRQDAAETEPSDKSRSERMYDALDRLKFAPASNDELTQVTSLIGQDRIVGAATYLNEIYLRQRSLPLAEKEPEMPARTLRAIVRQFGQYAREAKGTSAFLKFLEQAIDDADRHGFSSALSIPVVKDWQYDAGTARAMVDLLRMKDADELAGETSDHLGEDYSLSNRDVIKRIDGMLGSMRTAELGSAITRRLNQQHHRQEFWIQKLQEATNHTVAKPIAHEELTKLKIIEDAAV